MILTPFHAAAIVRLGRAGINGSLRRPRARWLEEGDRPAEHRWPRSGRCDRRVQGVQIANVYDAVEPWGYVPE